MPVRTVLLLVLSSLSFGLPAALKLAGEDHAVRYLLLCEDGVYESVGAFCLLAAALFFVEIALRLSFVSRAEEGRFRLAIGPWLWSVVLLLAFLEEISWGQRIVGVETPARWSQWSQGGELNLHNLRIFYGGDEKVSFTQWGFVAASIFVFLIVPTITKSTESARRLAATIHWPTPSVGLSITFAWCLILAVVYVLLFAATNDVADGQQATEVFEAVVEMLLLALAVEARRNTSFSPHAAPRWASSARAAVLIAAAVGLCWSYATQVWPLGRSVLLIQEGNAFLAEGDGISALRRFERATQTFPSSPAAWYSLALAEERLGATEKSAGNYRRAIELEPRFAEAHNNLGALLFKAGKIPQAIAEFEAALAADPNHSPAKENLKAARRSIR